MSVYACLQEDLGHVRAESFHDPKRPEPNVFLVPKQLLPCTWSTSLAPCCRQGDPGVPVDRPTAQPQQPGQDDVPDDGLAPQAESLSWPWVSEGFPMSPCHGPSLDSGGVCSMCPCLVYGIYLACTSVQIRGPY